MKQTNTGPAKGIGGNIAKIFGRICFLLVETVLLLALILYGAMYILAKGPSPSLRDLFVQSVRETSAVGFLANLYFSDEEIAAIEAKSEQEFLETDTSLIQIPTTPSDAPQEESGPVPDAWGLVDEDGDGIIVEEIHDDGYNGYMMVVLDPSRVIAGCVPATFGSEGYTVAEMVEKFGAVAGINAGGFEDEGGQGNGSTPDSMVVYEGKIYYSGNRDGFAGFDSNHILHVGELTAAQIKERDIQYGACFGPVLISNGEPNTALRGGLNPRTAIGQRSDGAVLLLVINGRQLTSLGASFQDLVEIFLDYGAVNACNLDGGSSSLLWYQGEYVNNSASLVGIRDIPSTFLVLPEGGGSHG